MDSALRLFLRLLFRRLAVLARMFVDLVATKSDGACDETDSTTLTAPPTSDDNRRGGSVQPLQFTLIEFRRIV